MPFLVHFDSVKISLLGTIKVLVTIAGTKTGDKETLIIRKIKINDLNIIFRVAPLEVHLGGWFKNCGG